MDPSKPSLPVPSHAGGRAASRGEASSSSSPPPPPPPQQQGCAMQPVPPPPQQQGCAMQPVPPPPPQQQQQGHEPVWMWVWQPTPQLPFEFGVPATWPIPPLHPQMSAAPTWPQQPQFVQYPPLLVPQPLQPPPPTHQDWRLVQIRSELFGSPMTLDQLVMSLDEERSAILLHQLEVGDEEMRGMVLDRFKQCAHWIMENRQGHAVFEALLRSIQVIVDDDRRREELEIIVEAAVTPELVGRSSTHGVTSLKLLITAVAWNPGLSTALVNYFLRDRVMDNVGGNELITRCFLSMDYEATRALVRDAIDTIDDKLDSPLGRLACLRTCFRYAEGEELPLFEDALVERAVTMAMGPNSNRLVQSLLDRDRDPDMDRNEFRRRLLSRLMQHVVSLSNHWYGRFVLRRCFMSKHKELQPIVLTACADLPQGDVQALVMQILPLHMVLQEGNDYPVTARRLALKIQALPAHIREHNKLEPLMSAVTRVLADNLPNLGD
ncbi:hypothetical protein VPH35_064565 [Triticum aestivum]